MLPVLDAACALLLSWGAVAGPHATPVASDTIAWHALRGLGIADSGLSVVAERPAYGAPDFGIAVRERQAANPLFDTLPQPQPQPRAFVYSDGYEMRLTWHRRLSWAMLPLFAASYYSGDQMLKKGSDASSFARSIHGPAAAGSAVLFGANAFTGIWNLYEGRHDPNGRTRRFLHGALFLAASGGFVYAGTLAGDLESEGQVVTGTAYEHARIKHRNTALVSMGVSTVSWLIMLIGN